MEQYLTGPSSGTLALVFVEGQQGAGALVGTGVAGVTRGVLRTLAVLSGVAERAVAGGAAGHGHAGQHGHGAVPSIQAEAGVTRVLVVAVLTQKARSTPGHTHTHKHTDKSCNTQRHTQGYTSNHPSIQTMQLKDEFNKKRPICLSVCVCVDKQNKRVSFSQVHTLHHIRRQH